MTCEKIKKDDEIGQKIMICDCNSFLNRIIFFFGYYAQLYNFYR